MNKLEDTRREQLKEQYDELAFALLMDEYAEKDGARLLKEFEEAQQSGDLPEIPADLDNKCQNLIDKHFARQKQKRAALRIGKSALKVAMFTLVFLGFAATMVMSVEALRVPVLNFFMQHTGIYTSLTTDPAENDLPDEIEDIEGWVSPLMPIDYKIVSKSVYKDGTFRLYYENDNGQLISFVSTTSNATKNVDTEDADTIEMKLFEYSAFYIQKDGHRIIWADPDNEIVYDLYASGLDEDTFWKLAYSLAE